MKDQTQQSNPSNGPTEKAPNIFVSNRRLNSIVTVGLALLFNYLFWGEKPGINYGIYTVLLIASLSIIKPRSWKSTTLLISAVCLALSLVGLVLINSTLSIWMFFINLFVFLGFYHTKEIQSSYYALFNTISAFFLNFGILDRMKTKKAKGEKEAKSSKKLKLIVIPLIITFVFYWIYQAANPTFAKYTGQLIDRLSEFLEGIFVDFSFIRMWFFILGLFVASYFLFFKSSQSLIKKEAKESNTISRRSKIKRKFKHVLSLLDEYQMAFMTFLMLNGLILLVNFTDIYKLSQFSFNNSVDLANSLHKGTFLLIISLILSIGVVVYYFRGNLNFLKDSKKVKPLVFAWISQNFILAGTVAAKCLIYINFHGLAYKRIGVLIFLLVTAVGLSLMYTKISKTKSVYFLLRKTSMAALIIMSVMATINIDKVIIENNLNHAYPELIDYSFLMELSDKALPIMNENWDKLEPYNDYCVSKSYVFSSSRGYTLDQLLERRIYQFKYDQSQYSWKSWNYADFTTAKALK